MHNLFFELASVLIFAGLLSLIFSLLKQPSIVAYIITGLIIGPLGYYSLNQGGVFSSLSEVGITLLLFTVGLQLDLSELRRIGRHALFVGVGQVVFTTLIGYGILRLLGFQNISSWFIAAALTFSSTIIVVKLLSEKKDLQSLYGKLVVSILLAQDFFAIVILIMLSTLGGVDGSIYSGLPVWQNVLMAFIRGLIIILSVAWVSAKVLPKIVKFIGHNDELMLVFSLAWALGLASLVSLPVIGFSLEIGGFLAGLSLARSGIHYEISGKIKPIRDFFIIIFFVTLGSGLSFGNISSMTWPAIVLTLFVLIGNPLIIVVLLGLSGFKPRTSFLTGISLGQVSEFSFILLASAYALGEVTQIEVSLVTLVGIVSIAFSSYAIMYSRQLYEFLEKFLEFFNFRKGSAEKHLHVAELKNHTVLVGAHRLGHHLVDTLHKQKTPFIVVDFNPEVVEKCATKGILAICGDITDSFVQDQVNLFRAKLIVSTVPDFNDNLAMLENIKNSSVSKKVKPKLVFLAQDEAQSKVLYDEGIDYVISPHFMGGLHLAKILTGKQIVTELKKLREHHLNILARS